MNARAESKLGRFRKDCMKTLASFLMRALSRRTERRVMILDGFSLLLSMSGQQLVVPGSFKPEEALLGSFRAEVDIPGPPNMHSTHEESVFFRTPEDTAS